VASSSATAPPRSGSDAGEARAAERPLDLHEGICDPREFGCSRWPEHLVLLNRNTGVFRPGRCKATNLCRYCQRLYVVETVEMLTLDAMEYAPTLWAVLTAREHLTRKDTYAHLRQLRKAARKRWPGIEWFVQVEFQRRGALHLNLLIKGVPVEDEAELHALLSSIWCKRVDAEPVGQWVGAVTEAQGVVRYLSKMLAHGLKAEQAPPIGWKGHRTSQTRGYLVRPAAVMRQEARRALKLKREFWKLLNAHPDVPADVVDEIATARVEEAETHTWTLQPTPGHPPMQPDHLRLMREAALTPFRRQDVVQLPACADVTRNRLNAEPGGVGGESGAPPARGKPGRRPPPQVRLTPDR